MGSNKPCITTHEGGGGINRCRNKSHYTTAAVKTRWTSSSASLQKRTPCPQDPIRNLSITPHPIIASRAPPPLPPYHHSPHAVMKSPPPTHTSPLLATPLLVQHPHSHLPLPLHHLRQRLVPIFYSSPVSYFFPFTRRRPVLPIHWFAPTLFHQLVFTFLAQQFSRYLFSAIRCCVITD